MMIPIIVILPYLVRGLEYFLFVHNILDNPSHWLIFFNMGWNHQPESNI